MADTRQILYTGNEEARLDIYPTDSEINQNPERQSVIGDMHGNALKLMYCAIREGKITISEDNYKAFHQIYIRWFDGKPAEDKLKEDIKKLRSIFNSIEVRNPGELCLIGDVLGDRGANDFLTLKLLKTLIDKGVNVTIIASNHDMDAISVHELGQGLKSAEVVNKSPIANMGPDQSNSLINLYKLYEQNVSDGTERIDWQYTDKILKQIYMPRLTPLAYNLSDDGKTISILSHAPIDLSVVERIAIQLKVVPFDLTTPTKIAESIDRINDAYAACIEGGKKISDLYIYPKSDLDRSHPSFALHDSAWNRLVLPLKRDPKILQGDFTVNWVNGHNGGGGQENNIYNTNNTLGWKMMGMGIEDNKKYEYNVLRMSGRTRVLARKLEANVLTPEPGAIYSELEKIKPESLEGISDPFVQKALETFNTELNALKLELQQASTPSAEALEKYGNKLESLKLRAKIIPQIKENGEKLKQNPGDHLKKILDYEGRLLGTYLETVSRRYDTKVRSVDFLRLERKIDGTKRALKYVRIARNFYEKSPETAQIALVVAQGHRILAQTDDNNSRANEPESRKEIEDLINNLKKSLNYQDNHALLVNASNYSKVLSMYLQYPTLHKDDMKLNEPKYIAQLQLTIADTESKRSNTRTINKAWKLKKDLAVIYSYYVTHGIPAGVDINELKIAVTEEKLVKLARDGEAAEFSKRYDELAAIQSKCETGLREDYEQCSNILKNIISSIENYKHFTSTDNLNQFDQLATKLKSTDRDTQHIVDLIAEINTTAANKDSTEALLAVKERALSEALKIINTYKGSPTDIMGTREPDLEKHKFKNELSDRLRVIKEFISKINSDISTLSEDNSKGIFDTARSIQSLPALIKEYDQIYQHYNLKEETELSTALSELKEQVNQRITLLFNNECRGVVDPFNTNYEDSVKSLIDLGKRVTEVSSDEELKDARSLLDKYDAQSKNLLAETALSFDIDTDKKRAAKRKEILDKLTNDTPPTAISEQLMYNHFKLRELVHKPDEAKSQADVIAVVTAKKDEINNNPAVKLALSISPVFENALTAAISPYSKQLRKISEARAELITALDNWQLAKQNQPANADAAYHLYTEKDKFLKQEIAALATLRANQSSALAQSNAPVQHNYIDVEKERNAASAKTKQFADEVTRLKNISHPDLAELVRNMDYLAAQLKIEESVCNKAIATIAAITNDISVNRDKITHVTEQIQAANTDLSSAATALKTNRNDFAALDLQRDAAERRRIAQESLIKIEDAIKSTEMKLQTLDSQKKSSQAIPDIQKLYKSINSEIKDLSSNVTARTDAAFQVVNQAKASLLTQTASTNSAITACKALREPAPGTPEQECLNLKKEQLKQITTVIENSKKEMQSIIALRKDIETAKAKAGEEFRFNDTRISSANLWGYTNVTETVEDPIGSEAEPKKSAAIAKQTLATQELAALGTRGQALAAILQDYALQQTQARRELDAIQAKISAGTTSTPKPANELPDAIQAAKQADAAFEAAMTENEGRAPEKKIQHAIIDSINRLRQLDKDLKKKEEESSSPQTQSEKTNISTIKNKINAEEKVSKKAQADWQRLKDLADASSQAHARVQQLLQKKLSSIEALPATNTTRADELQNAKTLASQQATAKEAAESRHDILTQWRAHIQRDSSPSMSKKNFDELHSRLTSQRRILMAIFRDLDRKATNARSSYDDRQEILRLIKNDAKIETLLSDTNRDTLLSYLGTLTPELELIKEFGEYNKKSAADKEAYRRAEVMKMVAKKKYSEDEIKALKQSQVDAAYYLDIIDKTNKTLKVLPTHLQKEFSYFGTENAKTDADIPDFQTMMRDALTHAGLTPNQDSAPSPFSLSSSPSTTPAPQGNQGPGVSAPRTTAQFKHRWFPLDITASHVDPAVTFRASIVQQKTAKGLTTSVVMDQNQIASYSKTFDTPWRQFAPHERVIAQAAKIVKSHLDGQDNPKTISMFNIDKIPRELLAAIMIECINKGIRPVAGDALDEDKFDRIYRAVKRPLVTTEAQEKLARIIPTDSPISVESKISLERKLADLPEQSRQQPVQTEPDERKFRG